MTPEKEGTDSTPRVGAVVLHYRFWPGIRSTLDALVNQSVPPDAVVVVDNGSGTDLGELEAAYPQVKLVKAAANNGYAAGMNAGVRLLQPDGMWAYLLLTHECILEPACLENLKLRMLENHTVGAVGPLLRRLDRPQTVWSAGGAIDAASGLPAHRSQGDDVTSCTAGAPASVQWLDGACILVRAKAAVSAGPLDERYFLYFEDAEYCARLRRLGWEVECVPKAVAAQQASEIPVYLSVRNRLGFLAATASRRKLFAELRRLALNLGRDLLRPPRAAERTDLAERTRALVDFLKGRWGPPHFD